MNRERIEKWCEALESGKYQQAKGALKDEDKGFCCLGVACDVSGLSQWDSDRYFGVSDFTPEEVQQWYGLSSYDPTLTIDGVEECVSEHNDRGVSFAKIAKAIREQILDQP